MQSIKQRLVELERSSGASHLLRWHRVIVGIGQTEEEAIGEYEASHGSIDANENILVVRIVASSGTVRAAAC